MTLDVGMNTSLPEAIVLEAEALSLCRVTLWYCHLVVSHHVPLDSIVQLTPGTGSRMVIRHMSQITV